MFILKNVFGFFSKKKSITNVESTIALHHHLSGLHSLSNLIKRHNADFPEFEYYLPIISKAEKNEIPHPDISIECCNSLIQGISKTIILRLESDAEKKEVDNCDTDKLVKRALKCIAINDDVYEEDFVRRCVSLAFSISTLRNARGDISHGKSVPKALYSDMSLSRSITGMTSSLLTYTLSSFYAIDLQAREDEKPTEELIDKDDSQEINYENNLEFNNYLDELNPLEGKPLYSLALYEQYIEDYEIQLSDYLYEKEQEVNYEDDDGNEEL